MSINERLSQLYDKWDDKWKREHPGERLVRHGLICEHTYIAAKPRIVLLGKELNCQGNPDFDLLEFLNCELEKGSKGNNFEKPVMQAGLWAYGILTGFQEDYYQLDHSRNAALGLKSIGWTNLSKICGGGKANSEWKKHACNQRELTEKELKIMNPQLILCSGGHTYALLAELLRLERKLLLPKENHRRKIYYSIWPLKGHDCLCLDFYHHAAIGFYEKWYWILEEVFDKCETEGLCTWK
ncbi:MAG: hypothetical protein NTZ34_04145 [Chloroflexi bacterium]|nr:hypothetical protein [Chloroflexota bacterium]